MPRLKKIYYLLSYFLLCYSLATAQTPTVRILGGICAGTTLYVFTTLKPAMIVWKLNGKPIDTVSATWNRRAQTVAGSSTGGAGTGASLLNFPFGFYLDKNDTVYVTDFYNNRVQKWAPGASAGITVAGTGVAGSADSQLYNPVDVYLDSAKNIFVLDYFNNRAQKFLHGATHASTVAGICCTTGSTDSTLDFPTHIYVDKRDTVYICDGNNFRIIKWAPGADSGKVAAGGTYGTLADELNTPLGMYIDTARNIYIADTYNNRVQKWKDGGSSGVSIAGSLFSGIGANQLSNPAGVYVDGNSTLYIADAGNNRIMKWANAMTPVNIAGSIVGDTGIADSLLNYPTNIYLDPRGNLFVSDAVNNRIQKFTDTIVYSIVANKGGNYSATVYTFSGDTASATAYVYSIDSPHVIITASPGDTICANASPLFTAHADHIGVTATYQWQKNSINVGTGDSVYSPLSFSNNDTIICQVGITNPCAYMTSAVSNKIIITIEPDTTPTITVGGNTSGPVGASIHLFATITGATGGYKINWISNGVLFATTTTPNVSYIKTGGTDSITATIIPTTGCYNTVVSNNWFVQVGVIVPQVNNTKQEIIAHPNPFNDAIMISNMTATDRVCIYDMMGRKVFFATANKEGENSFDVKNILPGAYIIKIMDKSGSVKAKIPLQKNQ